MDKYYYLVASLPLLLFDGDRFISIDAFLQACREQMPPGEYRFLRDCRLDNMRPAADLPGVMKKWAQWQNSATGQLARLRGRRLQREEEPFINGTSADLSLQEAVKKAFEEKSPLQAEKILDRAGWQELSRLEQGHYFDLSFLVLYYLKLQILHRQAGFTGERGKAKFRKIHDRIYDQDQPLENAQ